MIVIGVGVTLAVLAAFTAVATWLIERAHPPVGRFIEVAGARLHVVELGAAHADPSRPPIVMIHGASANLAVLQKPLGELLAARHRVILIDRPGHGWSTRERLADASTPAQQAAMVAEALRRLGVDRAVMVAHSWGGALGAAFALDHADQLAGLVLLAPVTHRWPGGLAWYHHVAGMPVIGALFARTIALPTGLAMLTPGTRAVFQPQTMPDDYVRESGLALLLRPDELRANAFDMLTLKDAVTVQSARYAGIRVPTVVITGDRDETVSPQIHSASFAAMVPQARLIVLPGVGHLPQNAEPVRIAAEIERLVDNATAAPAARQAMPVQ